MTGSSKAWLGQFGELGHPYTHPSAKQCNYSVDTSSFATTTQLNELKTSVSNGKSAIASAITDKGISTAASAGFSTMANNIRKIKVNEPHCFVTQSDFTFTTVSDTTMKITSSLFSKLLQITNGEYKLRASIYGSGSVQTPSMGGGGGSMFTIAKGSNRVNISINQVGSYNGIYTLYDTYIMIQITASNIKSIRFTPGTNQYGSPDGWIYI